MPDAVVRGSRDWRIEVERPVSPIWCHAVLPGEGQSEETNMDWVTKGMYWVTQGINWVVGGLAQIADPRWLSSNTGWAAFLGPGMLLIVGWFCLFGGRRGR